ncbi:MAG: S1C family serine protease, partial [Solimonas sp.]
LLRFLAILSCFVCASLAAQDLGPLLPTGQSPLRSPMLDRYSLLGENPGKLAGAKVSAALIGMDQPEPQLRLRGAKEIELYRTLASSVALLVTDNATGSASLIATKTSAESATTSGMLLTAAHVVGDAREVGVIFKPAQKDGKVSFADAVVGRVRKVDPIRDLALIEVANVPANAVVIKRGTMEGLQVGADVHAIGHPAGQTWTYTKGLISQIRPGFEWQPDPAGPRHLAEVIQTQTPINPGNSGGPLIDDGGRLIGVNSFKGREGEGLNFAVSVGEVDKFMTAADGGAYEPKVASAAPRRCEPKVMYEGRSPKDDAFIRSIDLTCSGQVNATLYVPDDKAKAVDLRLDKNGDGKTDAWIVDKDRDGRWDISFWDTDFDGKPDLVGYHPDGGLEPSRYEKYQPKS